MFLFLRLYCYGLASSFCMWVDVEYALDLNHQKNITKRIQIYATSKVGGPFSSRGLSAELPKEHKPIINITIVEKY